jgi:hypothetical protein
MASGRSPRMSESRSCEGWGGRPRQKVASACDLETATHMSVDREFETVDLILRSNAETRSVDAFCLAIIKAERQVRKLFTHLVYQCPAFGPSETTALRNTLASNRRVYFEGFLAGIDAFFPRSVESLVGPEFHRLEDRLKEAIDHRNKILHGQLTSKALSRDDLVGFVHDIREWCSRLASGAFSEVGYDGLGRNSFRKSNLPDLCRRYRIELKSIADYDLFIRTNMERRHR